jgi:lysophospholipase L1-like esterase
MSRPWIAAALLCAAACGGHSTKPTPVPAAPQVACPADITVREVSGPAQSVPFDAPVVSGGAAPVNVSCSQSSGTSFPLGTTPVNCTASDAQSRQATCAFNVTLKGFSLGVTKFDSIGDSFTAGENGRLSLIDLPNAYPTRLQAAFDSNYPGQGIAIINRGISGEKVGGTVDRVRNVLSKDTPEVVLFLTGYNDLEPVCGPGRATTTACRSAIDDVGFGLRDCIRHTKESPVGVRFIFVSTLTPPGPVERGAPRDRRIAPEAIVQANDEIRQRVASEGATLVDTYPLFIGHEAEYVDTDGLHLRPAGYQALADSFFAAIKTTIPQTALFSVLR